jgi:protein TonB
LCCLLLGVASFAASALAQTTDIAPSAPQRVRVSEVVASSLISEKSPLKYPDAPRNAGIQGVVVLKVVVGETGAVKEVTVVSGDPALAPAAADAVKLWKYKPFMLDGVPIEMETQVSINFHLKPPESPAPSLGTFKDDAYSNESFGFEYPLSRDWVRETQVLQKKVTASGQQRTYVLLAAVHIPQQTARLEADSSLALLATASAGRNCGQYLEGLADALRTGKQATQKGTISPLTIAGSDFYRADFDFEESPGHRTFLCTQSNNYLLQWNIAGLSKGDLESTVSTLNAMHPMASHTASAPPAASPASPNQPPVVRTPQPVRIRVATGVTLGLLVKRVQPVYPEQAKHAGIQGAVVMHAVISKNGDVSDLEVLDGPMELVVSAVNAVRQWKSRPHLSKGEPVEVDTRITVNYTLSPHGGFSVITPDK